MAKIEKPEDIQYLTFEGGGGLGIAYFGVIRALELIKSNGKPILPINLNDQNGHQIMGISGASAGAITAFLIALGFNSAEIAYLNTVCQVFLEELPDLKNRGHVFRTINKDFIPGVRPIKFSSYNESDKPIKEEFDSYTDLLNGSIANTVLALLAPRIKIMIIQSDLPYSTKKLLLKDEYLREYISELVICKGLFTGTYVRKIFQKVVMASLVYKYGRDFSGQNETQISQYLTFEKFYDLTKIELMFTATNVSKNVPVVFSRKHTPKMPVVEAVAISMNLPFAFKPIYSTMVLDTNEYVTEESRMNYKGWLMDGGILNNLPLHAFDLNMEGGYSALNPNLLAFRTITPDTPEDEHKVWIEPILSISGFLGNFLNTFRYPANAGQIRSIEENEQVINLNTYGLKLMSFNPPFDVKWEAIKPAAIDLFNYLKIGESQGAHKEFLVHEEKEKDIIRKATKLNFMANSANSNAFFKIK